MCYRGQNTDGITAASPLQLYPIILGNNVRPANKTLAMTTSSGTGGDCDGKILRLLDPHGKQNVG